MKVNDFAKSLGLKEDIFTTKTTYSSDEKVEVLKHSDQFNDFLEHYGVLGMKWGVRKSAYATAHDDYKTSPKDKVVALDDISVEENNELASIARSVKTFMSDEYRMLSENSEWIVEDFLEKNKKGLQDPKRQEKLINQLQREVEKDLERFAQEAIDNEFPGTNHKAKVDLSDNWCTVTVGTEKWYKEQNKSQLKHADDYEAVSFKFELKRSDGTPLIPKNIVSVSHSDMIVGEFLEHHGVLGMKWGVRKDNRSGRSRGSSAFGKSKAKSRSIQLTDPNTGQKFDFEYDPRKVTIRQTKTGTTVEGRKKKEVKKVLEELKNAKKGLPQETIRSKMDISNDELRAQIDRLRLERDFQQLTAKPQTPAQKKPVQDFMVRVGGQVAAQVATQVGVAYLSKAAKININKVVPTGYAVDAAKLLQDKK